MQLQKHNNVVNEGGRGRSGGGGVDWAKNCIDKIMVRERDGKRGKMAIHRLDLFSF